MSHIDPFILLIGTLYLCAYTELAIDPLPLAPTTSTPTIRIDQSLEDHQLQAWIEVGNYRPHLTGVGALDTARSASRLLKESSRIMAIHGSKSPLARALSRMLLLQAEGRAPIPEAHE